MSRILARAGSRAQEAAAADRRPRRVRAERRRAASQPLALLEHRARAERQVACRARQGAPAPPATAAAAAVVRRSLRPPAVPRAVGAVAGPRRIAPRMRWRWRPRWFLVRTPAAAGAARPVTD